MTTHYSPEITRPVGNTGTQKLYRFPNNYGASVVRHDFSYGSDKGLWELAVIEYDANNPDSWGITYSTSVTDDVIGYLTDDGVNELLVQIEALPTKAQEGVNMKPHKYASLIKAWADGAEIEYLDTYENDWLACPTPGWCERTIYRIKPHKHQALIDAFNGGAEIEFYNMYDHEWEYCESPTWDRTLSYRIKCQNFDADKDAIIADLKAQLAALQAKPQWEPVGEGWWINGSGEVYRCSSDKNSIAFGTERKTKELAERAAKEMRAHNRLLAYRDEVCPDYEPNWDDGSTKHHVSHDATTGRYNVGANNYDRHLGIVCFPKEEAHELCRKLNSGEVML